MKHNPNYPLVHYRLGQAFERKGQLAQARAFYQQFLEVWKEADSDMAEILAAKKFLSQAS